MKVILVQSKYNYQEKFKKALKEGKQKYINSLYKRGKAIITDFD